jgi:hypothetical protein
VKTPRLYRAGRGTGGGSGSAPGTIWTLRTSQVNNLDLYGVTYGNELFVAVGKDGTILTSPDGVNWTVQTSPTSNTLYGVTYGDGLFVAVGGITTPNTLLLAVPSSPLRTG